MIDRRSAPASYRDAQLEARSLEDQLLRETGREIERALGRAADAIASLLQRLPDNSPDERLAALRRSLTILQQQQIRLARLVEQTAADGRELAFTDILQAWQDATAEAAKSVGLSNAALGEVLVPRTTLLAAYEGVGGARHFRTLIDSAAQDGFRRVNDVIRAAILKGESFDSLAKDLRAFVRGGEGGDSAAAFRTVRFNALRIAYSEIHNARAEAEVQHFALDPLVVAVAWRIAPDRGTLRAPDICDVLGHNNFYGLGVGVYPVDEVPLPPHPFCRCERVPIVRDIEQIDEPKPAPDFTWPGTDNLVIPRDSMLSDQGQARVVRDAFTLLHQTASHPIGDRIRDILP